MPRERLKEFTPSVTASSSAANTASSDSCAKSSYSEKILKNMICASLAAPWTSPTKSGPPLPAAMPETCVPWEEVSPSQTSRSPSK